METYYYTCDYCQKEFVPTRRGAQRFCKPSCKTRNHQKKRKELQLQSQLAIVENNTNSDQTEIVVNGEVSNSKKEEEQSLGVLADQIVENSKKEKQEDNKMSIAGTADAAAGALFASGLIGLFTKEENKPVTKKEMLAFFNHLDQNQRVIYHLLKKQENEFKPENFG